MHVVGVAYVTGTLFFEVNDGLESVWLKGWIMAYQSVGKQKNSHKARRPVGVCALRLRRDPHVLLHADPELDLNLVVVPDVDALHQPGNDHKLIVRRNQRTAVLLHGSLLLYELLSQHGQLGFCARDDLFIVLYASPGQSEGGLGFLDLLVDDCARNCWSPATARPPVRAGFRP